MNVADIILDIATKPCILAWFGAVCGHILSLYSDDFKGTQPFLKKMFPEKSDKLLPIIGAVLSIVLLEPDNLKSAIFAELSWSGTLIALLNNKKIETHE